ncbi:hypothetical protein BKA67DRAFT_654624 [Truncatella angustata]|uniref:Uncharacterized protein n=1 Tax=Truncatella angustata TaxID=152316 RepID=A0A9P8UPY3_9PEZI|nr:uncharacterized protein BKA67DRAFT_654624 [Truncatella angustata]KAH6656277.1 hypothetical protein BKA67DRAFT_654624 [Truncatella angustata]KAH8199460.1 hypothetical protein TruAng_006398 [Truncatella angustata]
MIPTLVRRAAAESLPPHLKNAPRTSLDRVYNNSRYKPKKVWPPDFSKLSQKEQFRFEKKYKRRVVLATARPRWDKYVKMAQLFSVTGVAVYSILFMDWNTEHQPFQGLRNRFWGALESFSPSKRHERRNDQ